MSCTQVVVLIIYAAADIAGPVVGVGKPPIIADNAVGGSGSFIVDKRLGQIGEIGPLLLGGGAVREGEVVLGDQIASQRAAAKIGILIAGWTIGLGEGGAS